MQIFLPYKNRIDILRGCGDILTDRGHTCVLYPVTSMEKMRQKLEQGGFDVVLSGEGAVLSAVRAGTIPKIYVASDFFCPEKLGKTDCLQYIIPHEELRFDFINAGAREKKIVVGGVPVSPKLLSVQRRGDGYRALGFPLSRKTITLFADGVPVNEIKATVRATRQLCPDCQMLLQAADPARRKALQSTFAEYPTVFVMETDYSLGFSVGDVLLMPAVAPLVSAAARLEKPCILLHTPTGRLRHNAAFLDSRGVAFCGKTAADNVSYAGRLLESKRLCGIMLAAQEKYMLSQPEKVLIEVVESAKKH